MVSFDNIRSSGVTIFFVVGAFVFIDIFFNIIGGIPFGLDKNILLYYAFKIGVGYFLGQWISHQTSRSRSKYMRTGSIK